MIATTQVHNCPICNSSDLSFWTKGRDRLYLTTDQEFTYKKCNNCKSLILADRPGAEDIHLFYPASYGPYFASPQQADLTGQSDKRPFYVRASKGVLYVFSRVGNAIVRRITSSAFYGNKRLETFYTTRKGRALDFGCGSEKFLNEARSMGYETVGMDFSPQAIDLVLKHGHKGIIYSSDQAWNELEDNSFDVIRMNHVIEHLLYPADVMKNLLRKLKPGGAIHIATPNGMSMASKVFKKFFLGLDCPRHIVVYSPKSLKAILEEVGYKKVEIVSEVVTKDIARSIGFWENEKGWISHPAIESKVSDGAIKSIFFIPSILLAKWNKSDRIHAFAVK